MAGLVIIEIGLLILSFLRDSMCFWYIDYFSFSFLICSSSLAILFSSWTVYFMASLTIVVMLFLSFNYFFLSIRLYSIFLKSLPSILNYRPFSRYCWLATVLDSLSAPEPTLISRFSSYLRIPFCNRPYSLSFPSNIKLLALLYL